LLAHHLYLSLQESSSYFDRSLLDLPERSSICKKIKVDITNKYVYIYCCHTTIVLFSFRGMI
jgi:hypothetical protein